MKLITHEVLHVEGVQFLHIQDIKIEQKVNEHACAVIKGEVEREYAKSFTEHVTEFEVFTLLADEDVLFRGILENTSVYYENTASVLELNLISTSKLLDCIYESHSYQNCQDTYFAIIKQAVRANGEVFFNGQDKELNGLVMQYEETSWNFMKRMAGKCGLSVYADCKSYKPMVYIGKRHEEVDSGQISEYGNTGIAGITEEILSIGSSIGEYIVSGVLSQLHNGVIQNKYVACKKASMPIPSAIATGRQSYTGKVFSGIVQNVERDRVQVHLVDIDECYDNGGDWWFPYSTVYSSKSDAGFYCMPQEGDIIRVFFPTERPEDAFAASGPNMRGGGDNKDEKRFESPTGMSVHYTKKGMSVNCKGKKVYIEFGNNGEIKINANTSIYFSTPGVLNINAAEKLSITSDEKIYMGVDKSFIQLSSRDGQDAADVYSGRIFVR